VSWLGSGLWGKLPHHREEMMPGEHLRYQLFPAFSNRMNPPKLAGLGTGQCWRQVRVVQAARKSRAVGCKHHPGELLTSTIVFVFRGRGSPHQKPGSTGRRLGLLAARLEQHDYTWLHFHFPTSPVYASIQRWLFSPEGAAEHNALCICQVQGGGRHQDAARAGKGVCSLRNALQDAPVLYILAHTRRYKQNVHLLMKDQPAWKRHGLERKCIFGERQEQILQHAELFLVNNIGYRSKLPFSVSESQVSQASPLLGNIFRLSSAHRQVGYRWGETQPHAITQSFPPCR